MSSNGVIKVGDCLVEQDLDRVSRGSEAVTLRPQVMEVLVYLASRAGETVHADELLENLWPDKVVTSASVYNCITELRQAFLVCDDGQPYVDTIPKKGYRLVAPVFCLEDPKAAASPRIVPPVFSRWLVVVVITMLVAGVIFSTYQKWWVSDPLPRSIAVLPFENRSALLEDAFFVDGIHDDILTRLATISAFDKVISRTSVERYRDTTPPMPQLGQELGVTTIIEGGVQRAGNQVQVNVQLIDAATDNNQWAATYQRELTAENIFAIQAEIADAIVTELQINLSPQEQEHLEVVPTNSMEALEHYFRGRDQLRKRTSTSVANALDQLQTSVAVDPNFALAHATLAEAYDLARVLAVVSQETWAEKGREHVTRALALDPESGEAYSALGAIESWGEPIVAGSAFRKAIDLSPNNANAHYNYCLLLGQSLGEYAAALEHCEKAQELDPFSPIIVTNTGATLWGLDRLEEAQLQIEKASDMDPAFVVSRIMRGWMDSMVFARLDQAVKRLRTAYSLDVGNPHTIYSLVETYLDLGDTERAAFWYNELIEILLSESDFGAIGLRAQLHIRQGDTANATELARKHFDSGDTWPAWPLTLLRDEALQRGRPDEARKLYTEMYPDFLDAGTMEVTALNYQLFIDFALVLSRSGELELAERLMGLAQKQIRAMSRTDPHLGYGIADVQIHAISGNEKRALSSLREAINEGWRFQWWFHQKHDLALEPLRNGLEFQEMFREIEAEMTAQLERTREMEANGELAPIPE